MEIKTNPTQAGGTAKQQKIVVHLWYETEALEAANYYCSVFPDSEVTKVTTLHDTPSGDCEVVTFNLCGQEFMAISAGPLFKFNESISLMVMCETQEEMDHYTEKLSAVPEAEQCGWVKDRYGLSWQITPTIMNEVFSDGSEDEIRRVTQAMLEMKRLDIDQIKEAAKGE